MIVAFIGPSLPGTAARASGEVIVLPPARRGDILAAIEAHAPDAIALVDGYFEQVPSVWHKEILFALAAGITVAGAASMGALRAAELWAFGMVGVGRVFEAYAGGRFPPFEDAFEDDDEVAVVHGPAEAGYPATDALVDIRATLAAAVAAGLLDLATATALVATAKRLFYKDRSYAALLDRARADGIDPAALDRLAAWLPSGRVLQKRADAEALLTALAHGTLHSAPAAFRFERTLIWERWQAGSEKR